MSVAPVHLRNAPSLMMFWDNLDEEDLRSILAAKYIVSRSAS